MPAIVKVSLSTARKPLRWVPPFVGRMPIRLPRGRVLEGPMLAGFEKERARIEGIMSREGPARTAQAGIER